MRGFGRMLLVCLVLQTVCGADVTMPAIFSDNMVLQREKKITLWGNAEPGSRIAVSMRGNRAFTQANKQGAWKVELRPMMEGGPYTLKVRGSTALEFENVMVGEVWLCSGQSNMEMPLQGWSGQPVEGSKEAIGKADYPDLRLFTVQKKTASKPQKDCEGTWSVCTPESAAPFSATAFFFGRKLLEELDCPIGLIDSTWGGTPAEAWTTGKHISTIAQFKPVIDRLRQANKNMDVAMQDYKKALAAWSEHLVKQAVGSDGTKVMKASFDAASWPVMQVPSKWSATKLGSFTGAALFRKEITIPQAWEGTKLVLSLGPIDDMDLTFLNGEMIGEMNNWMQNRVYTIPAGKVKAGKAVLSVVVINPNGEGGIYGSREHLSLCPEGKKGQALSLAGAWSYKKTLPSNKLPTKPADPSAVGPHTPSALFNGMIRPLVPYTLRGAIWYQGESNTYNPKLYREIFPAMIRSWRDLFDQGQFPFYYVQIAPFPYGGDMMKGARIREVQRESLSRLAKVGMAVLMDKTSLTCIHPPQKEEAGERLALWALAKDYGKKITFSGPLYKDMKVEGDAIRVSFHQVKEKLTTKGKKLEHFEIAGKDMVFHPAEAVIDGKTVVVKSDKVKDPAAVRYGFKDTATATLFNEAGLPASSFTTEDW